MNINIFSKPKFAVIGAGHGGLAMAGHLSIMGFDVNLFNRSKERLWGVLSTGGIEVEGEVEGFGKISLASDNIAEVIENADIIMVVLPATGHRYIAEIIHPHLKDNQIIVLNPGRTFGAIEFQQVLRQNGCTADVIIAEAQTFIYASRAIGPCQAKIFKIKNSIPVASIRAYKIPEVLKKLRVAFPQFVAGDNVFKTSFDNIGAVFHPVVCMMNAGWIEDVAEFQFYCQGITESVAIVLEKIDEERVKVAEALGIRANTAKDWLYLAYGVSGKNLHNAIHANPGYAGIMAPRNLFIRYITEDVPMSLVPIASIGEKFDVEVPTIKSFIHVASIIHNCNYWEMGRNIQNLNIEKMSLKELRLLAIGEK
jgi:opine dehydrogenase